MNTAIMSGLLVAMLVAASVPMTADARERGVNQRQHNHQERIHQGAQIDRVQAHQHERIAQGVRSGELTRPEARRLMAEQRSIAAQERRYMADGVLTRAERADMLQDLNAAGRHIYNETHDAQARR